MKKIVAVLLVAFCILAAPALAGTTLRVVGVNHPYVEAIRDMIPEFEKETGIKVNLEMYGEDQLGQKLTTEFAAGGSSVDVFSTRPPQDARVMYRNGWYADLAPYIKATADYDWDDFSQSAHDAVTFDGFVVAIPTVNECHVMYYRKDLLEAKGLKVPTTMEELYDVVGKVTDRANDITGVALRGQRSPLVTQFSSFLFSYGGDFFDNDMNATINTPEALAAMKMYGDLLHNYGPEGALNMSWPQAAAIFAQGKAAFWIDASSLSSNVLDPAKSTVADKTGVAVFPAGPAGAKMYNISQWALGIYSGSQNKDAAWQFVEFMTNKKGITYMQGTGLNQCPRQSVWETPEGTAKFHPEWVKAVAASTNGVPYDRPLLAAVSQARDIIGEVVTAAIEGRDDATVKQRADQANVRFQALLDREKQ
ncbi:MAG: sugar ABC transporter substrate-binding protein [Planctomycetaceae bacterium]|nr:sugar ABC transporter substrate-binding protein [Planctomycetaceae bacterium]